MKSIPIYVCVVILNLLMWTALPASAQKTIGPIDLQLAKLYFDEAEAIFDQDRGALWGHVLNGPMLFVDPSTRTVVANVPDPESVLRKTAGLFVGKLPSNVMIANTSTDWGGQKWTMLMWPLPRDKNKRRKLLAHEAWHHIQDKLGFKSSGAANNHLDSLDGRYLLQLEWRALSRAIESNGDNRIKAITDALSFRALRQLKSGNVSQETSMEMHEGLAEYTGFRIGLSTHRERQEMMTHMLRSRPKQLKTFIRSFAYLSGPAYGLLLDEANPDWVQSLKPQSDLAKILANVLEIQIPTEPEAHVAKRRDTYDGIELYEFERKRDEQAKQILAKNRSKFVTGTRLEIPIHKMKMSFNPNETVPLDDQGTVYKTLTVSDRWGVLKVSDGAMISSDFKKIVVSIPPSFNGASSTNEWNLEIAEGWSIEKSGSTWRLVDEKR